MNVHYVHTYAPGIVAGICSWTCPDNLISPRAKFSALQRREAFEVRGPPLRFGSSTSTTTTGTLASSHLRYPHTCMPIRTLSGGHKRSKTSEGQISDALERVPARIVPAATTNNCAHPVCGRFPWDDSRRSGRDESWSSSESRRCSLWKKTRNRTQQDQSPCSEGAKQEQKLSWSRGECGENAAPGTGAGTSGRGRCKSKRRSSFGPLGSKDPRPSKNLGCHTLHPQAAAAPTHCGGVAIESGDSDAAGRTPEKRQPRIHVESAQSLHRSRLGRFGRSAHQHPMYVMRLAV